MSTISELLAVISNAVYGKDVRQAIVDSIQACYDDATGNPESLAALVAQVDALEEALEAFEADPVSGASYLEGVLTMPVVTSEEILSGGCDDVLGYIYGYVSGGGTDVFVGETALSMSGDVCVLDGGIGFTVSSGVISYYLYSDGTWAEASDDEVEEYLTGNVFTVYITLGGF